MSNVATPYGLRPINLIGGQPFAGQFREFKVASNNSAAIFNGDVVALTSAGVPYALTSTPTATAITAATPTATLVSPAGIVGVCVGVRYVSPATKQPLYGQYLPANSITNGYTDVFVRVLDDPDALFQIQGSAALGTFNSGTSGSGWPGAIGKNAALGNFSAGSTTTGNSAVNLVVGTNGASLATTATLAMRIVDMVEGAETDSYPEFIVKFNHGVHSYYVPQGV
jgi:hypothetical protein